MNKYFNLYLILSILSVCTLQLNSMVYDNRYFPLYLKPFVRRPCALGHLQLQPFFMVADSAQGDLEHMPIPDLKGTYDIIKIINSLLQVGTLKENPLRSDLQGISNLEFKREGNINSEGIAFFYELPLWYNFAIGTSFLFMHVNSRVEFCLDRECMEIGNGDRQYLFNLNSKLDSILNVTPPIYNRTVFGDVDLYLRWAVNVPYFLKFRSADFGFKFGTYMPSSPRTPYNNPASAPVGGQGHWGLYADIENQYEFKEDWYASFMLRAIKRLPNSSTGRSSASLEPYNYGALVGSKYVNPGWTFVFNPAIRLEGIRDGFGVTGMYTLVSHLNDKINIQNKIPNTVNIDNLDSQVAEPKNLEEARSSWGMEYVTIGAFYDFSKSEDVTHHRPIFSVYWDVPIDWLVSRGSVRTNAISLALDF